MEKMSIGYQDLDDMDFSYEQAIYPSLVRDIKEEYSDDVVIKEIIVSYDEDVDDKGYFIESVVLTSDDKKLLDYICRTINMFSPFYSAYIKDGDLYINGS